MSDLLTDTISAIEAPSPEALRLAQQRQAILTKPAGSLGLLERIGVQLAAIAGSCPPPVPERGKQEQERVGQFEEEGSADPEVGAPRQGRDADGRPAQAQGGWRERPGPGGPRGG